MTRTLGMIAIVTVLGVLRSTAAAQSVTPSLGPSRLFGDVAAMAGIDTDGTGDGPAIGLGIGLHLSPRKSVRVEVKLPKRQVSVSGLPTSSVYVREATRVASYSLVLARHLGQDRQPHVELLGGLSGMLFSSRGTSTLRLRSVDGSIRVFEDEINEREHTMALTAGLDGVFPLTRRFDLVPQLRVDWIGLGALVRAGMTLRLHF